MYREIFEGLESWKEKDDGKILFLFGGRFVGKTFTLKKFGEISFSKVAYFDLDKNTDMLEVLDSEEIDLNRFDHLVKEASGDLNTSKNTLVIIESIDGINNICKTVKWLKECTKWSHIAITSRTDEENIVGEEDLSSYVKCLKLHPLSFKEFLITLNREDLYKKLSFNEDINDESLRRELSAYIRKYIFVGGMPKAVAMYKDTVNMAKVQKVKQEILEEYQKCISDIVDSSLREKVRVLWRSVGKQLEKDNKKFQYGTAKPTARTREYVGAMNWLLDNKLLKKVSRAKEAAIPLKLQKDIKSFECFLQDVGILCALYGIDYETIEETRRLENIKNGAIAEQFVYNELMANKEIDEVCYWISGATSKVEFIFERNNEVKPVEINLSINTKAQSIKVYNSRYNPSIIYSIASDLTRKKR